ncbi:MAG: nitroreductase family protein [Clostridia bacterium]|nr:nitroreductase family protein [Clostridia bacterium]
MERWFNAIKKRTSVRRYTSDPTKEEFDALKELADYLGNDRARIVVKRKQGVFDPLIGKAISGTNTFAVMISSGGDDDDFSVGTIGEAFVLECTAMGLGTCWLGLSYNRSVVNSSVALKNNDERIRCVISIGHFSEIPAKERSRKIIYNLTGIEENAYKNLPEWQRCAVEAGRLAPSARNAQPWEFDILKDLIRVACISRNFGYGAIDCGIAMLHIELGAAHSGVYGSWKMRDHQPVFKAEIKK